MGFPSVLTKPENMAATMGGKAEASGTGEASASVRARVESREGFVEKGWGKTVTQRQELEHPESNTCTPLPCG